MVSRSARVGQAFGSKGVLNNAAKVDAEEVGGGVEPVANEAALGTGNAGDLKFATATKSAFLYDGSEWDRIQTGNNAAPFFNKTATTINLGENDSATVNVHAGDPEGFPITYSWDALKVDSANTIHYKEGGGTFPPGVTNIIHSSPSSGTFRFQSDSSNSGNEGAYTYRILASDGAITTTTQNNLSVAYGLANCYGFKISQTSAIYGHTVFQGIILDGSGLITLPASWATEATIGSASWSSGVRNEQTSVSSHFRKYFDLESQATFGYTLPSTWYTFNVSHSGGNAQFDLKWTNPRTITGIMISGDMTNGYDYFSGGYVQAYIGSNTNLDATQYTLVNSSDAARALGVGTTAANKYYDFRG